MVGAVNPSFAVGSAIRDCLRDAALWWIGSDCCELLEVAAPSMPGVTLTAGMVPDLDGFAFFERPVSGQDAQHPDHMVSIDAMHWQPAIVAGLACVSIVMWSDALATTTGLPLLPMGRSDWPYGFDTDHPLDEVDPDAMASIIEDRRLLAALWQLTTQTDLVASTEERPNRPASRRLARRGHQPSPVRLVSLNQRTGRRRAPADVDGGRAFSHRWIVKPHWRQQAYGPGRSLRRARYIAQHVKGPADKPLRVRDTVKVWTRP
jgi:hypothetical protein